MKWGSEDEVSKIKPIDPKVGLPAKPKDREDRIPPRKEKRLFTLRRIKPSGPNWE